MQPRLLILTSPKILKTKLLKTLLTDFADNSVFLTFSQRTGSSFADLKIKYASTCGVMTQVFQTVQNDYQLMHKFFAICSFVW